jgi:exodeoxyribonuclease V gamma subunit
VVANVEFIFPGRFMTRALGDATRPDDPEGDPWRLPRLTWPVLEELAAGTVDVPRPAGSDIDRWALARRIADLFDRYATQRPRLVQAWAAGADSDGTYRLDGSPAPLDLSHRWQADLWRAVQARIGEPSPPERLGELLAALRAGSVQPQLPDRVTLFGFGGLAPTLLNVLKALAESREVHVFLRHPSQVAWDSSPHRLAGDLSARDRLDVTTHTRHPLLASWGRPSLEARALIAGDPALVDRPHAAPADGPPATLLSALQQGIRVDEPPAVGAGLDPADGSLQVHACHGEVRQLEALRDALGHAFVADPTLAAHEVFVLCPDLQRFAPLVEAVFARGALPVPVRIGDRSLTTVDPLVGALQSVLALVAGRATLTEVLGLIQFEPVRRRFGWSVDQVEQLATWAADLGTRWGLSADHRSAWGLPGTIANGTWRSMVDQLLAGMAMPAPSLRAVLGGVVPYDDITTGDYELVGSLAELLARLVDLHASVQGRRPIGEWVEVVHGMVDDFCAVDTPESWRRLSLHRDLDAIADGARSAAGPERGCVVPLTLADLRGILADALGDRPGRPALRSGAVTVSSLVPQHGVPARVICLLGLDDGTLRGGTFDGDDVLGKNPCVGERHPRFESRELLLDAVLAARERLIITCNGADLTTNERIPFIVPLVELLDVAGRLVRLQADLAPVVVRHPRHGFNEQVLRPGGLVVGMASPFTFDPSMLAAAEARRASAATAGVVTDSTSPWALPPVPFDRVDIDELVAVVTNPSKVYLSKRLEVRLPGEAEVVDDNLAVAVASLLGSALGRELLAARAAGHPVEEWSTAARLRGVMPPGELSTVALDHVGEEVAAFEALAAAWGVPLAAEGEVLLHQTVSGPVDGVEGTCTLEGIVRGAHVESDRSRLVDVRFTRPRPSFRLAVAVRLAAAQREEPAIDWSGVVVHRGSGDKPGSVGLRLRGAGAERVAAAERLLHMAVQLLTWARRDAVPFFDRTSSPLGLGDLRHAIDALEEDLRDEYVALLWPQSSIDSLLTDPLAPTDPPVLIALEPLVGLAGRGFLTARWVWSVYADCVEEFDVNGVPVGDTADDAADDGGEAA